MIKLLRAGFSRFFKSKLFWVLALFSLAAGIYIGFGIKYRHESGDVLFIAQWCISAAFYSLTLGAEFSNGTIRNKIIAGNRKSVIFASELILAVTAAAFMFVLTAISCYVTAYEVLPFFSSPVLCGLFFGLLFSSITSAVLCVTVGFFVTSRSAAPLICILIILAVSAAAPFGISALAEEKYYYSDTHYNEATHRYEPSGELIPNSNYIGGIPRVACEALIYALPYGQLAQFSDIIEEYTKFIDYPQNPEIEYQTPDEPVTLSVNQRNSLSFSPLWSCGAMLAVSALGCFCCRKKDVK